MHGVSMGSINISVVEGEDLKPDFRQQMVHQC